MGKIRTFLRRAAASALAAVLAFQGTALAAPLDELNEILKRQGALAEGQKSLLDQTVGFSEIGKAIQENGLQLQINGTYSEETAELIGLPGVGSAELKIQVDPQMKRWLLAAGLDWLGNDFLDLSLYGDTEELALTLPQFFVGAVGIRSGSLAAQMEGSAFAQMMGIEGGIPNINLSFFPEGISEEISEGTRSWTENLSENIEEKIREFEDDMTVEKTEDSDSVVYTVTCATEDVADIYRYVLGECLSVLRASGIPVTVNGSSDVETELDALMDQAQKLLGDRITMDFRVENSLVKSVGAEFTLNQAAFDTNSVGTSDFGAAEPSPDYGTSDYGTAEPSPDYGTSDYGTAEPSPDFGTSDFGAAESPSDSGITEVPDYGTAVLPSSNFEITDYETADLPAADSGLDNTGELEVIEQVTEQDVLADAGVIPTPGGAASGDAGAAPAPDGANAAGAGAAPEVADADDLIYLAYTFTYTDPERPDAGYRLEIDLQNGDRTEHVTIGVDAAVVTEGTAETTTCNLSIRAMDQEIYSGKVYRAAFDSATGDFDMDIMWTGEEEDPDDDVQYHLDSTFSDVEKGKRFQWTVDDMSLAVEGEKLSLSYGIGVSADPGEIAVPENPRMLFELPETDLSLLIMEISMRAQEWASQFVPETEYGTADIAS